MLRFINFHAPFRLVLGMASVLPFALKVNVPPFPFRRRPSLQ
jgi:hypothetical protein